MKNFGKRYSINNKIVSIVIIFFLFFSNYLAQNIDVKIVVNDDLEGILNITFKRSSSNKDEFFVTSINLGDNVRHKDPSLLSHNELKNYLAGSWYDSQYKDIIVGAKISKGKTEESIKILLPKAIHGLPNNCFELLVKKSNASVSNIFSSDSSTIYLPITTVKLEFEDNSIVDPESKEWERSSTQKLTYILDLTKKNSGYIKYYRLTIWDAFEASHLAFIIMLLFASYFVKASFVDKDGKTTRTTKIIYFALIVTATLILTYLLFTQGVYATDYYKLYIYLAMSVVVMVISYVIPNKSKEGMKKIKDILPTL